MDYSLPSLQYDPLLDREQYHRRHHHDRRLFLHAAGRIHGTKHDGIFLCGRIQFLEF